MVAGASGPAPYATRLGCGRSGGEETLTHEQPPRRGREEGGEDGQLGEEGRAQQAKCEEGTEGLQRRAEGTQQASCRCEKGTQQASCEEGTQQAGLGEEGSGQSEVAGGQGIGGSDDDDDDKEPMHVCMMMSTQPQVQQVHLDPKALNNPVLLYGRSRQEYEDWTFSTRSYVQIHGLFTVEQLKAVEVSRQPINLRQLAQDERTRAAEL